MPQASLKLTPEPELLSTSEIAKRLKLNRETVRSRLEDLGYEPEEVNPKGPNAKMFRFDSEMEFALKSAKDTVSATKIRVMRADAQLKELKLAEARGEMVVFSDAVERMQAVLTKLYKEIGLQMPKRVSSKCVKKPAAAIAKLIKADVDKVFAKLRENDAEFVPQTK